MKHPVHDWYLNDQAYHPNAAQAYLGRIPLLINPESADPVWQQVQDNYPKGWNPELPGKWTLTFDDYLIYPGLPPVAPAAMAIHRGERVLVYPAGWLVVVNDLNSEFTVVRIEP